MSSVMRIHRSIHPPVSAARMVPPVQALDRKSSGDPCRSTVASISPPAKNVRRSFPREDSIYSWIIQRASAQASAGSSAFLAVFRTASAVSFSISSTPSPRLPKRASTRAGRVSVTDWTHRDDTRPSEASAAMSLQKACRLEFVERESCRFPGIDTPVTGVFQHSPCFVGNCSPDEADRVGRRKSATSKVPGRESDTSWGNKNRSGMLRLRMLRKACGRDRSGQAKLCPAFSGHRRPTASSASVCRLLVLRPGKRFRAELAYRLRCLYRVYLRHAGFLVQGFREELFH